MLNSLLAFKFVKRSKYEIWIHLIYLIVILEKVQGCFHHFIYENDVCIALHGWIFA